MDTTTEGVTLYAVFVQDVLRNYEDQKEDYQELFDRAAGIDLSDPMELVPIDTYNALCDWIEQHLGKFNLIQVGRNVGETAYANMVVKGLLPPSGSNPHQVLKALKEATEIMVQDPQKRGWVILETGSNYAVMRRTQNFNSKLQLGLLSGLVRKTNATGVEVVYQNSVEEGAEYDDYRVSWL